MSLVLFDSSGFLLVLVHGEGGDKALLACSGVPHQVNTNVAVFEVDQNARAETTKSRRRLCPAQGCSRSN